jgi:hypothetical protein
MSMQMRGGANEALTAAAGGWSCNIDGVIVSAVCDEQNNPRNDQHDKAQESQSGEESTTTRREKTL